MSLGTRAILPLVPMDGSFAAGIVMANSSFGTLNERGSCNNTTPMIRVHRLDVFGIPWSPRRCSLVDGMGLLKCGSKRK